jgi:hypothetical protein
VATGNVSDFSSLALDSGGNPHIGYSDDSNHDLKYARWTGSAWAIETVDSAGNVGDYSSLALDSADRPHIGYRDSTNGDLKYARWTGSAWAIETVDSAGNVGYATSLALDSIGSPRISYYEFSNHDLKYATWTDSGWDVQTVDSVGYGGGDASLALDSAGGPHISYLSEDMGDLKYARWNGSAWAIETVNSAGNVGYATSLALDSNSNPHISYYDAKGHLRYARWTSSGWIIQVVDSTGNVGYYTDTSLALDSSDNPHISYCDYTNWNLMYASWDGSAWAIQAVDSAGYVGWYSSLALDSADRPHISYRDDTNLDLKYARWTGSAWAIETVDSTGNVGLFTSIALDSADRPHISYFDSTGNLKYARWNGWRWAIETVASAGIPVSDTSLALDSGDNPHISYCNYSNSNGRLMYARWTGSAWAIETVDSTGNAGYYSSLALDSSGNPHISYQSDSKGNLEFGLKYATSIEQCEVTFNQAGVIPGFGDTVVTIDSVNYGVTDLPLTFTWDKGGSHTFSYASPLNTAPGMRQIWSGTSGLSTLQSDTLTIKGSGGVTANYKTQYLVHYVASGNVLPVTVPADEWVKADSIATGVFPNQVTNERTRCIFIGDSRPHDINAPTTITGTYLTQYQVFFAVTPVGSGSTAPSTTMWADTGKLSINATANPGYMFSQWSSNTVDITFDSQTSSTNATISGAGTVTASFVSIGDVAVVNLRPVKDVVGQGYGVHVKVQVENQAALTETFTVSLYANNALIGAQAVTSLTAGATKTLTFLWSTTGWSKNAYTLKAVASAVPGETDTDDNTLTDGSVLVSLPGDLNGDKRVNTADLLMLARDLVNAIRGKPWNPNCDINNDGNCNSRDLTILLSNFGKSW